METPTVRERLRQALGAAVKARDTIAVSALRSALGAIDNASAIPAGPAKVTSASSPHFAGAVAGLGAGEAERRGLTEDSARAIVLAEVTERRDAAREYERAGHTDRARRLRQEADVLVSAVET